MLKTKIGPHFVIQYDHYMALTASSGSCDLYHALWGGKNHYRGRTAAKQGRFWKTLVKNASFVKCRFLTRVFGVKMIFFFEKKN